MQSRGIRDRNPIIVLQMGKVGSSTVLKTLQSLGLEAPILHCHTTDRTRVEKALASSRRNKNVAPNHLLVSKHLAEALHRGLFPCRIITLTREPVDRAISFAFENWRSKAPGSRHDNQLEPEAMRRAIAQMLLADGGHADPTQWFERELKSVFGIDVFSQPFDHQRGFVVCENHPVRILVLKLEALEDSLPSALEHFLGVDALSVAISCANRGQDKWYASSLAEMKSQFKLTREQSITIYSTRYAKHFYAPELESLVCKWSA